MVSSERRDNSVIIGANSSNDYKDIGCKACNTVPCPSIALRCSPWYIHSFTDSMKTLCNAIRVVCKLLSQLDDGGFQLQAFRSQELEKNCSIVNRNCQDFLSTSSKSPARAPSRSGAYTLIQIYLTNTVVIVASFRGS
jgi:hypothetical protein